MGAAVTLLELELELNAGRFVIWSDDLEREDIVV